MNKLFASIVLLLLLIPYFFIDGTAAAKNSTTYSATETSLAWDNIKVLYTHDPVVGINKKSVDQFLEHDLIYNIHHYNYDQVKTELLNAEMAKQFKDKNVDIYGTNYYYQCYFSKDKMVEENGRKSCMYGGITKREGNIINKNDNGFPSVPITVEVYIDEHQSFSYSITTNKINVTAQELDIKARKLLIAKKQIYDGHYKRGYIKFKEQNHDAFQYDMFPPAGTLQSKYLMIYKDNKTVDSGKTKIEVQLYTR